MISIIIPIYNAGQWLNECLNSIAQQSYKDFEVLMVDDGSKDESASLCKAYEGKDVRFHYFYQDNAGVSVARNTGLKHAVGEWISFIDSDDIIDNHFLDEMVKHTNDADAVWCCFSTAISGLGKRRSVSVIPKEKLIYDIIFEKGNKPQLWSLLYKRNIISEHNILFTPGCVRNEDYEFFMKYLSFCQKPVVNNGYVGYYYRQNPQSVMHQKRSLESVIMSIEASSRVGDAVQQIGIIPNRCWLTAFSVTGSLYIMSRENNLTVYEYLHNNYPVREYINRSLKSGSTRIKCVALLYTLLGPKVFYKLISKN